MRNSIVDLVPYNPGKSMEVLEKEIGKPVIRLHANESLWGPSPRVTEFLKDFCHQFSFYPDGSAAELKRELGDFWDLEESNFCVGNGTDEILFLAASAFLNPGDRVIIPTPTFSEYAVAVKVAGGEIVTVPQPYAAFRLEEIAQAVDNETKMVFLCNPNNPTGTIFSHRELTDFLDTIPPTVMVLLDEAYCHFAADPAFPESQLLLAKYKNLVVTRTFSKIYSIAALRVGYAVADKDVIGQLNRVRQPFNVNALGQKAAAIALKDRGYTQHVQSETVKERDWLTEQLLDLDLMVLPSQANFILAQFKNHNAAALADRLLHEEGIMVRHTASFNLPEWLRITVGPHAVMEKLVASLQKYLSDS